MSAETVFLLALFLYVSARCSAAQKQGDPHKQEILSSQDGYYLDTINGAAYGDG